MKWKKPKTPPISTLIKKGVVELEFYDTTIEHAREYGLEAKKPLFLKNLLVVEEERLKGIGTKALKYLERYARKNGYDVIFGAIYEDSVFTKGFDTGFVADYDLIKFWLHENGYAVNDDNYDYHRVVTPLSK
jgi:GNAT superfamily N-acetyltransferase